MNARAALRPPTRRLSTARLLVVAAVLAGVPAIAGAGDVPAPHATALVPSILGSPERAPEADPLGAPRRLDPDRPHFPEASTTVGNGRAMLEAGYTMTRKGSSFVSEGYPEALLRAGLFADWLEIRVGQSFVGERRTAAGATTRVDGAQDLYLGAKLALTEQDRWLPAIAVIPQMTVPTGSKAVTAHEVLPGVNVDAAWEVVKDLFGIELLVANNRVRDERGVVRQELATGVTGIFQLTKTLELFVEWDAAYPVTRIASTGPRDYAVSGLVYFITPDFAVDARAGVGLNDRANDVVAGIGFAVRY